MSPSPLLSVRNLVKRFPVRSHGVIRRVTANVHAVNDVSLDIYPGETLALVGESGSGKTTTGRCILRLIEPSGGAVTFDGEDVTALPRRRMRALRSEMQIVFQDPHSALDPRMTAGALITDPLKLAGMTARKIRTRLDELLDLVGLSPEHADRYPHQLSGGQLQRVGIARALSLEPRLVVLDEPVSALDVSIQAGVLNLLARLQAELGLSYLLIAHDLAVVRHIATRVAVMNLGRIVETGETETLYRAPAHPYTNALLSAVPVPDPATERRRQRIVLSGELPDPANLPSGCLFRTRCWKAEAHCAEVEPELIVHDAGGTHTRCHFPETNGRLSGGNP